MAVACSVRRKAAARARPDQAERPRHRGARLRRESEQEFHAVGRPHQDLAHAAGGRWLAHRLRLSRGRYSLAELRRHAGQGDRLGADPRGRDQPAQPRSGRDRCPRHRHQHSVPVRAGDAPGCARQRDRHRLYRTSSEGPDRDFGGAGRDGACRRRRRDPADGKQSVST